jgi:hypothetical protein
MLVPSLHLPPFGNVLNAYQKESIRLEFSIYLFVGKEAKEEAYSAKRLGILCTYLPYGDDYKKYNWPFENQKVIVFDTGGLTLPTIKRICFHIYNHYNPSLVYFYSENFPMDLFLSKDIKNGQQ